MTRLGPSVLLALLLFSGARVTEGACSATCKTDVVRCMATQCDGVPRAACRRRCKPVAIRTLAYAQSECQVDATGRFIGHQSLRIRRGDREPITVWSSPPSAPIPDPQQLCSRFFEFRWGSSSVALFPLQRLGVSPDGSGVVFEVNDQFSIIAPSRLSPDQEGIFFVRSDGHGLRYLGPPSQDPSFTVGQDFIDGSKEFFKLWVVSPPLLFSPNGRQITFTDLVPGPGGEKVVQIFVLDITSGHRTQVTRLPSAPPPKPAGPKTAPYFPTCCPKFIDDETILFQTFANPDGLNPGYDSAAFTVRVDGSKLTNVTPPGAPTDSHLVPSFAVTGLGHDLARFNVSGTPVNHDTGDLSVIFPIAEVFVQDGRNLLQLTNFRRIDTFLGFLSPTRTRAFFLASANPPGGENPEEYCQIFSMDTFGRGLRQVTHLNSRICPPLLGPGCAQNGIGYGFYRLIFGDPVTNAVVFESPCNLVGANQSGYQLFALRPDGTGLRQLTDASGLTINPDHSMRVELAGPSAYSAPYR